MERLIKRWEGDVQGEEGSGVEDDESSTLSQKETLPLTEKCFLKLSNEIKFWYLFPI